MLRKTNGDCHAVPFYPLLGLMKWSFDPTADEGEFRQSASERVLDK